MPENLTGFNHDFATVLIFTETVLGGDPLNPDGQFRHFVDAYYSGLSLPPLYHEPEAEAIRATLDQDGNPINDSLQQFLDKHSLKYNAAMTNMTGDCCATSSGLLGQFDPVRAEHIKGVLAVSGLLLRIQLHELGFSDHLPSLGLPTTNPTYDEVHQTVYGEKPVIYDITPDHQKLTTLLRQQGFDPSHHQGLSGAIQAWRLAHPVDVGNLESVVQDLRSEALLLVQANVVPHLPAHHRPLEGLKFVPVQTLGFLDQVIILV